MPHRILNDNWSEYDNRMIRDKRDGSKFSCEETWEVDYLVRLAKKHFPHKSERQIREAISSLLSDNKSATAKKRVCRVCNQADCYKSTGNKITGRNC